MQYPVFEFERKKKKSQRRRRIQVVMDSRSSSPVWFPVTVDYSSRVRLDSGTVEGILCVNLKILELS